ncbi:hypothetical protein SAMN02744133_10868 [Thalassospira xiamenensis M-5 = DSM 17429]|uniref:hypothetical protein n=1 Tax=Thalassospira xiamenensis TaxID=220697 RepID=UPI000955385F|nr:hypothetical protein [Thalassospira xiamenensis]SIT21374.1 hypothetical protein SAMN02744133_10868 [Thalassospira xiamenensis M-5 = DSM 17429]|tara:strand:- start:52875 stop:53051 length:177 start_codon:yes stop_codon:yes gene_type:complete
MKRMLTGAAIGLIVGAFLGSMTGVAAMGTAVNGMWVFGLIGAFIGGLVAFKRTKPISK